MLYMQDLIEFSQLHFYQWEYLGFKFQCHTARTDVRAQSPAQVYLTTEPLLLTTKLFDPKYHQITWPTEENWAFTKLACYKLKENQEP